MSCDDPLLHKRTMWHTPRARTHTAAGLCLLPERSLRDVCHFLSARTLACVEGVSPRLASVCRCAVGEIALERYSIAVQTELGCVWSLEKAGRLALTTPEKEQRLRDAAKAGDVDEAKEVLRAGVDPDAPDPDGWVSGGAAGRGWMDGVRGR